MRASRTVAFWILWVAVLALAAWGVLAPPGYLLYSLEWANRQRHDPVWPQVQEAVATELVVPELKVWAQALGTRTGSDHRLFTHRAGTPVPPVERLALEERYRGRGIQIFQGLSYWTEGREDVAERLIADLFGIQPFGLQTLFAAINHRLAGLPREPRVAWVYVITLEPDVMVYWPGGNQYARYKAGYSPSLAYDGVDPGQAWLRSMLAKGSSFNALSGDSLGFGDTMITAHAFEHKGVRGIIAADIYWEQGPIGSIRAAVLAYSAWFGIACLAIVAAVLVMLANWARMFLRGDGVCVTIDIVGWSKIDDVEERLRRQELLDRIVAEAFFRCTRQRMMRWFTGDGYHVLFMNHWGASTYREVILFIQELLIRWNAAFPKGGNARGSALRVAVGTHGYVKMRRKRGSWYAIGDRIVSAVRIDEVSKSMRPAEDAEWTIAIDEAFRREVNMTASKEYQTVVRRQGQAIEAMDKAENRHTFSFLTLDPSSYLERKT